MKDSLDRQARRNQEPTATTAGAAGADTAWSAVWAVAAGSFALVVSEFLAIGLLPDVASSLHVSEGTAGLMVTVPGLMAAVSAPLLTVATARMDRRTALWSLTVLLTVSNLLAALAPAFWVVMAARLVLGVAVGGFWTIGVSIAPRLVPSREVPRATAAVTSGITLGTVASLPLGALASDLLGWRSGFFIAAGLAVIVLGLQIPTLPRLPVRNTASFGSLMLIFRMPRARAGVIASALIFFGHFAGYTYLLPALHDLADVPGSLTTPVLLLFGLAGVGGNFAAGAAAARGVRRTLASGIVVLVAALALFPILGASPPAAVVLVAVWGTAWGALPVALQLWILESMGETADSGLALFISASQTALAAGAFVGGLVVDGPGIPSDLLLAAGISALSLIALWAVRRRPPVETG